MDLTNIKDIDTLKNLLKSVTVEIKEEFAVAAPRNCRPPLVFKKNHRYFFEQVDANEFRIYMDEAEGFNGWDKEDAYALFTTKEMEEHCYQKMNEG